MATSPTDTVVLVVDDEDDFRDVARSALELRGHRVVEATNGKEALALLTQGQARPPQLIVLDLNMPVMTGWELLAQLASDERLARIPVLVVSAALDARRALRRDHPIDYLGKPFDVDRLMAKVEALLGGASASPG